METTASASSQGCHKNPASTSQPVRRRLPHPYLQLHGDAAKSSHGEKTGQLHNRARASRTTTTKPVQSRHYKYLQKIFPLLPREEEGTTKQLGVVIVATNSPTAFTLLPNQVLIWLISQILSPKISLRRRKKMQDPQLLYFSEILFDSTYYKISEGNSQYFTPERSNKKNMYLKKKHSKSSVHT